MNWNAVLEDLAELGAVWVETAITDAEERRGFLAENEAGGVGERLTVVVAVDARESIEVEHGGLFADIDFCALEIGQERTLDGVILFCFRFDP